MPESLAENHAGGAFDRTLQPGISSVNFDAARLLGALANRVGNLDDRSPCPKAVASPARARRAG